MSTAIREEINGLTPQDLRKLNDTLESLWDKVHGNVEFADTDLDMRSRVQTQWLPVQSEGNLDSNYPLYIRFYVPPNTKKVKSTSFNVMVENYRMDSGVAKGGGGVENVEVNISGGSGSANITMSETSPVAGWGVNGEYGIPPTGLYQIHRENPQFNGLSFDMIRNSSLVSVNRSDTGEFVALGTWTKVYSDVSEDGQRANSYLGIADISGLQHTHRYRISQQPHTHTASGQIRLDPHEHDLEEGIKVSSVQPNDVNFSINDQSFCTLSSNSSILNDIDITEYIKIGQWNTIKVTSNNVARAVLYGVVELIIK